MPLLKIKEFTFVSECFHKWRNAVIGVFLESLNIKKKKFNYENTKRLSCSDIACGIRLFYSFRTRVGKLQMLVSGDIQFPALFGISPTINLVLAVLAEFVAGIMVLIGLRTRLASIPLMITMLTAALVAHSGDPLFSAGGASKEFALLYFVAFAGMFFLGSGKYSVDAIAGRR